MSGAALEQRRPRVVFAPGLRSARILWRLLPTLTVILVAHFVAWLFDADTPAYYQLLYVAGALLVYGVLAASIREVLSPDRPWLRLIPVSDLRAHRLDVALHAVLFFVLLAQVVIHVGDLNDLPPVVGDATRVVRNIVLTMAVFIILGTTGFFRWLRAHAGDSILATTCRFVAKVVFPIALVTLLAWSAFRGFGYYPLAAWVARNAAWTTLKVFAAVLVYRWVKRTLYRSIRFYTAEEEAAKEEAGGETNASTYALGVVRILMGLVSSLLSVGTFLWILNTWALSGAELLAGLDVVVPGGTSLTWKHLLVGLIHVGVTLWAGWLIRSILLYFVFPRSNVGVGARYAILAMLRYGIIGLAIVLALRAFGIDTSSLSWFFGAAGIGLAFGLQDIIGNFVGGLIMLVERPIRVGDIVQVGDSTGTVEEIRMRGTTLRTFDNTTLLIPNSQMLGERVTNLTHGLGHARIKIPVIAPHEVDVSVLESILLDAANGNEDVISDPAPFVWLSEFSPSSLDFTLVCYTSQLRGRFGVASKIRIAIMAGMRSAGIDIPLPKQEMHVVAELPEGIQRGGFSTPTRPPNGSE